MGGYCVNLHGQDQNGNVIKLSDKDHGHDEESQKKCLNLCASYSTEILITACEAIHGQWNRGCYAHTKEVFRGNGVSKHKCWPINKYEPVKFDEFLPAEKGYCENSNGHDQNSGVIKLWGGDFGPSEEKQMECFNKCIAATAVRKATGCEAIWDQGNRGCYLHTKEVAYGNSADRHTCLILKKQRQPVKKEKLLPTLTGYCVKSNGHWLDKGIIKIAEGDFGPSEEKQMECLDKCIAASAERKITACQAIWDKDNRGCYVITTTEVVKNSNTDLHSCWII